jgi:hypothetical protein
MKRFLLFVLVTLFALPLTALSQPLDLKIKGVEIGTPYSTVIRKLGKPLSRKESSGFPCDDGPMLTLHYLGLTIKLIEDNNGRNFFVASMEVTSPKWIISETAIGESIKDVQRKFGKNNKMRKEKGLENLPYFIKDGYANFYFRNKKLVKVAWELNAC